MGASVNYDQPRQLESGGWHYTSRNDDRVYPVGYCADHRDAPHATEDEARACYARYMIEQRTRLDGITLGSYNPCTAPSGCTVLTNRAAAVGAWIVYRLCDEHRTAEVVAELYGPMAGDSVHS
jgi:hypothetical protein